MNDAWMSRVEWESVAAIYLPLMAAIIARLLHGKRPRQFASCLLSLLWVAPALLAMQSVNAWAGWWSFTASGPSLRGMPVACLVGWTLLWGVVPQLVFRRLAIGWVAVVMIAIDLATMPLCHPLLVLGPGWLAGEALAVAAVLIPALCIARWTQEDSHLHWRAAMQAAIAGMVFLFLLPEVVFSLRPGAGWAPLLDQASWLRQLSIQMLLLLAVPGVSAVMEFANRGHGTPIPYDPPQRLVMSGMYRYIANPMQVSCAAVMLLWAGILRNGWMVLAAAMATIYSAGVAEWDERLDLELRFGDPWRTYRREVRNWRPRWRPHEAGPLARVYIAASCGPCSEVRAWLAARQPVGLEMVDAETLPWGSIRRMRYEPGDGGETVDGVRAMARALEHINFGWAVAGAVLRMPGVWQTVQLLMDASGLGPRIPAASHAAAELRQDEPGAECR